MKALCAQRGESVAGLLADAGVSRNAFYTLARRDSILPKTVESLAVTLGVDATDLLEKEHPELREARVLLAEVDRIMQRHEELDRDTIRHTLLLLREEPVVRLRRALQRGQQIDIQ